MVQGVYGIKSKLPAIGGNEGVSRVESIGSAVKGLKVGDWVIPSVAGFGTWREKAVAKEDDLLKIPNDIPVSYAATIAVNPCTAFRLLNDFVSLKPGDVIIQNGANSMVGLAVIQLARHMGVKTINVVRSERPDCLDTLRLLTNLGGDINIPDTYLNTEGLREILKDLPPCKLAFNCVGGEESTNLVRSLATGATVVTYGGMSKKPFIVPLDLLTQRQISLKGFWMAKWNQEHTKEERSSMINEIADLIRNQHLTFFYEEHDFDDFDYALKQATEPFHFRKVVLNMDYPDRMAEHDKLSPDMYDVFKAPVKGSL
jgi:trans-2-enoyl-CoA reductase